MTRRSSSSSALFNVNWITGMKVQTTNDKKPVKTILMPFDAMYCSTVAAYIFHLSLSIIRCVRFFLNLTVFVSRYVCGCSSSLLFTVCVCCFLFLPVLNLSILSARPVCINYTHISTNASTLDFFISNELEWASFLWFCFLFLLYFFFLILFAIFIIIIVVTIIVILHRLSALPMDTLTDLFGSLIIVCNSSLFYKWVCVWMVYMCCFRRLTLNIIIKGSKRYKNNT